MLKSIIVEENFKGCFYCYTVIDLICYQDLDDLLSVLNVDTVFKSISQVAGTPNDKEMVTILLSCKSLLTLRAVLHR